MTLISTNISLILVNRSWHKTIFQLMKVKNPILLPIVSLTFMVLFGISYIPYLQELFRFSTIPLDIALFAIVMGFVSVLWFEVVKLIYRKKHVELLAE
jgi:P-type Ca2+ transporter type 2C